MQLQRILEQPREQGQFSWRVTGMLLRSYRQWLFRDSSMVWAQCLNPVEYGFV